ncbi:MAG: DUF2309 domain-containing protein [Chromatiaceae bacterium]|nr:DUF2309 domain-containing protein [Chromatiaceae bacterium]
MSERDAASTDIRKQIRDAVTHLEHVLPGQAPIKDFVHHNTLHGFQHLPFHEAIAEARRLTGNRGYLPQERFRELLAEGRITSDDLRAVLDQDTVLQADEPISALGERTLKRYDIYLGALAHPLQPIAGSQLIWHIQELQALTCFQSDVGRQSRERLLASARASGLTSEAEAIGDLWSACLSVLGLEHFILHPEELVDLTPEQAERMLADYERDAQEPRSPIKQQIRIEASQLLEGLLDRVGPELTLRALLQQLTGQDLLDGTQPLIVRYLASFLDQGVAAWSPPGGETGFYHTWRDSAKTDLTPVFQDLQDWTEEIDSLPADALEAIIAELQRMGLPRDRWVPYLERLALEVPGWSGMVLWRQRHPNYENLSAPVAMLDYLAVRLVLERVFAQRLCRRYWQVEASLDMLRWYFRRNGFELLVRHGVFAGRLPEYLAARSQRAVAISDLDRGERDWDQLAELIWTWRRSPSADRPEGYTVYSNAWPLFRLAQHLGLAGTDIRALGRQGVATLFDCLERLDDDKAGHLWLLAYERHYREQILTTLARNHGRGRWAGRESIPSAQVMLCMDDREEGLRRHLEELVPEIETLGAAAHFSVPHNWRGLDDAHSAALAPVIPAPVIPAQEVCEVPRPEAQALGRSHARRHARLERWFQGLQQGSRRGLLPPVAGIIAGAPLAISSLIGKVLIPVQFGRAADRLRDRIEGVVPTGIEFIAPNDSPPATPEEPRLGFTDQEQAERVQDLLRGSGLTYGFSPLVVILGHGSRNLNNPHASAYNCGACSGRFSGPNARLAAAMANRSPVRALLEERGISIPDRTWFVGGEHDTCLDNIFWSDLEDIPDELQSAFEDLRQQLQEACLLHAQERCRRFASAPTTLDPQGALRHVEERSLDFSQARPELGHATNACAFIGRRSMSRGAFFDRRSFLISYDPTQDPDGEILERHLLTNGAVGAGISLEYYFSAANNPEYGAGTKITHNVTGWLGVMEGAASDLRTGLPNQMIEIHEPMRLLAVVEQTTELLTAIYRRQPPLQELVGNGWVQLVAKNPESGAIQLFEPNQGWVPWQPPDSPLRCLDRSIQCYAGRSGPCPPTLIAAPDFSTAD